MNVKTLGLYITLGTAVLFSSGCKGHKSNKILQTKAQSELVRQPQADTVLIRLQDQLTKTKYAMIDSIDAAATRSAKLAKR